MIFVLALLVVASVHASSNGVFKFCELDIQTMGCPDNKWSRSADGTLNRANCTVAGRQMSWASGVKSTPDIVVFAGSNEAASATEYSPGLPFTVSVRVKNLDKIYAGLLMYAMDGTGAHVGSWRVIDRAATVKFQSTMCPPNSVVHSNAEDKPTLVTFVYIPPSSDVGPLTIESLIKSGTANFGEFWLPAKITLAPRASAPPPRKWYKASAKNQTCNEVCAAKPCAGTCVGADLATLDSAAAIDANVTPFMYCSPPYLLRCAPEGPSTPGAGTCFYRNDALCKTNALAVGAASTCGARPTNTFRICPCSCAAPPTTTPKTTTTTTATGTVDPTAPPTTPMPTTTTEALPTTTADPDEPPTVPPEMTKPVPTTADCSTPGSAGCACAGTCRSGMQCEPTTQKCVYTSSSVCTPGSLGCSCGASTPCVGVDVQCSAKTALCVRTTPYCEDHNAVEGCWCNDAFRCGDGFECSAAGFCVNPTVCVAGSPGCACSATGGCTLTNMECAPAGDRMTCLISANSQGTTTYPVVTMASSSASRIGLLAALSIVAIALLL